jgi:hypothetical protein
MEEHWKQEESVVCFLLPTGWYFRAQDVQLQRWANLRKGRARLRNSGTCRLPNHLLYRYYYI